MILTYPDEGVSLLSRFFDGANVKSTVVNPMSYLASSAVVIP